MSTALAWVLGAAPKAVLLPEKIFDWVESSNEQAWYPIPGYELRAPLTWPSIPQMVER
jgi:hypothetical protein